MLHCAGNSMRTVILSVIVLASGLASAEAADPTGGWRVADGAANNPDVSKKNKPTLGMPILIDMKKKAGADQWEGQVYNAKDGQLYSSTITPTGPDQLEIKSCVLGFLCGGESWARVAPPIPNSPAYSMAKGAPKSATPPKSAATTGAVPAPKT